MTDRKRYVLSKLCACENGKGTPLPKEMKRIGGQLIRDGYAFSIGFGSFEVFIATDAGRDALRNTEASHD